MDSQRSWLSRDDLWKGRLLTERLYYRDPYLRTFGANLIEHREIDGRPAVVLDASAFYPMGGGQPHDTGRLGGCRVLDVVVADDGAILHVLDHALSATSFRGEIDWGRRFDHMQQHTGQHILSQAFLQTCQAETVGFHLGEAFSTIDLDRAPLGTEQVAAAEQVANQIVMDGRPVIARFVGQGELAEVPLRKMPVVDGPIRIVQITEFDWSPCGGTHVCNSAQVGPIKVTRVERRKSKTRIYFLCGWRALADYAHQQGILRDLTAHLTTSENEILASVQRVEGEIKRLRKALSVAQAQLLEYEIVDWVARAESIGGMRIVRQVFDERDLALLKQATRSLVAHSGIVALLAVRRPRVQFVFARSEDVPAHMGNLMRAACTAVGGRGGGRPQFAQGGAPEGCSMDKALDEAIEQLKNT
jgi:alanyl-tRNA synthetase